MIYTYNRTPVITTGDIVFSGARPEYIGTTGIKTILYDETKSWLKRSTNKTRPFLMPGNIWLKKSLILTGTLGWTIWNRNAQSHFLADIERVWNQSRSKKQKEKARVWNPHRHIHFRLPYNSLRFLPIIWLPSCMMPSERGFESPFLGPFPNPLFMGLFPSEKKSHPLSSPHIPSPSLP